QRDIEFGKEVVASVASTGDFQGSRVLRHLAEEQLADFYLWLTSAYPEEDSNDGSGWGKHDFASAWRNAILNRLQSLRTEKACEAIQRIMQELPHQAFLKWSLHAARESSRYRNWSPVRPEELLAMARNANSRLVRDGQELLGVVIESLGRFES